MSLNPKQQIFVKEYLIDLNGKQAAIRAGYSEKTAEVQASRLLSNDKVAAEVQKGMDKRSKKLEITAEAVLQEIAKMAFSNLEDFMVVQPDGTAIVDLSKASRDQLAALSEIQVDEYIERDGESIRPVKKIKLKMSDKRGNLELLGRHLKLFTDKVDVNLTAHEKALDFLK